MAPHLSYAEQNKIRMLASQGKTPEEIRTEIGKMRSRRRGSPSPPAVQNIRKALKGQTYKVGAKETRGRKRKLTPIKVSSFLWVYCLWFVRGALVVLAHTRVSGFFCSPCYRLPGGHS